MPYLVEGAKGVAKSFGEGLGKISFEQAKTIWDTIKSRFGDDKKIETAAKTVASNPQDEDYQSLLAKAIGARLRDSPDLAEELFAMLGGQETIQEVLADKYSWVEDIEQTTSGKGGRQIVQAKNDSVIKGVKQIKK
jgi:predicted naringenin-chalcone synthase